MIKAYKYVEIKGAMKQTHRRVEFMSDAPQKVSSIVEFIYHSDAKKVKFHVVNETDIVEEQEFMIEPEFSNGEYVVQTTLTYKGRHQLVAIEFDENDNEIKKSTTFIINVK